MPAQNFKADVSSSFSPIDMNTFVQSGRPQSTGGTGLFSKLMDQLSPIVSSLPSQVKGGNVLAAALNSTGSLSGPPSSAPGGQVMGSNPGGAGGMDNQIQAMQESATNMMMIQAKVQNMSTTIQLQTNIMKTHGETSMSVARNLKG